MKTKRLLFAILLSMAFVAAFIPTMAFADTGDADGGAETIGFAPIPTDCEAIELDTAKTVKITDTSQVVTFAFTPNAEGDYYFGTSGSQDTMGCVLTSDQLIGSNDDCSAEASIDMLKENDLKCPPKSRVRINMVYSMRMGGTHYGEKQLQQRIQDQGS